MNVYILYGQDRFRAREELQAIRRGLDRDGNLIHNTVRLDGRSLSPADLRAACHAASFFVENRLVIVEDLQPRLSGVRRRGRRGGDGTGSEPDQFLDVLLSLPETTTVVLLDERPPAALIGGLGNSATVRAFEVLNTGEVRQWLTVRAQERGAKLSPAALERLLSLIDGSHLGELAQELDKLAAYAQGRDIEAEDVDELVSSAVELHIWDLTDAVIEGRGERALAVLRRMDARNFPPQLLVFMLVRQYRQLLLGQALLDERASQAEIGARLGVSGFPLKKLLDRVARYPSERLDAAYRRLLETDVAVKTGVMDVEPALETLIVDLADLARQPRRTPVRR